MSIDYLFDCSPDRPVLSFIDPFFNKDDLDETTIRFKEILMKALNESESHSVECLNGNIPVLICKKGLTTIKIREIYRLSNEISFVFLVDGQRYVLIFKLAYDMKNCANNLIKFARMTADNLVIFDEETFKGKFCKGENMGQTYDGENGYLVFTKVKDVDGNPKKIEFLISDFMDSLDHAIEYGDWKQFITFCNTDSKDKGIKL